MTSQHKNAVCPGDEGTDGGGVRGLGVRSLKSEIILPSVKNAVKGIA